MESRSSLEVAVEISLADSSAKGKAMEKYKKVCRNSSDGISPWAWCVINISAGKRPLSRSKKLNEWHHLAKVVPLRLAGMCKVVR